MSSEAEITAASDDIARMRARMSDTASEIEERVSDRVRAVKDRLDPAELVRRHPWPSLAAALGAGALLAASGADRKVASAAVQKSRDAATSGAEAIRKTARHAAASTADATRHAPSRTRSAITGAMDSVAARLALSLIDALREPRQQPNNPEAVRPDHVAATSPTNPADARR